MSAKRRPLHRPTICLNMIVRDEAHVISETLDSVAPHIDAWVIVDTGSTDGTQAVVTGHLAAAGIPGELHERPWQDFGTNRTEALELCAGKADYAWVIDADDLVVGDLDLSGLKADSYLLRYGTDFGYWRKQLFRLGLRWRYVGAIHEYPACDDPCTEARLEGAYHLESRRLGARSRTPETNARDRAILLDALERDPDDERSAFYLAQTLFDAGDYQGALDWYTRRAEMAGWDEETAYSLLRRGACLEQLGEPWERALEAYLDAWQERPTRAEPLHEIARHYRTDGKYELGYLFATRAREIPPPDDLLFVANDVYAWRARDEAAVCAYYVGRREESFDLCTELLEDPALPEAERDRVCDNRDLSVDAARERAGRYPEEIVRRLARRARGRERPRITATITTCRRPALFERTMNSFLNCCEDVDRIGRWICIDNGSAPGDQARMQELYPFLELIATDPASEGHAASMNRLLGLVESPYWLHLEDDWDFVVRTRYIGRALAVLRDDERIGQVAFNRNYGETLADRDLVGGSVRSTRRERERYRLQTFVDPATDAWQRYLDELPPGSSTCAYWPHFTLRPSLLRTSALHGLGRFDEGGSHFELEFANRYQAAGRLTAFFDEIHCLHSGRLTSDRAGEGAAPSAYELRGDGTHPARRGAGPGQDGPADVAVINLDRRPDRWESFTRAAREAAGPGFLERCRRVAAVDGLSLRSTPELRALFEGNDFGSRRGFVACALSHLSLWHTVAAGEAPCLILEDDVQLGSDFERRLAELEARLGEEQPDFDLVFLGYLPWHADPESDGPAAAADPTLRPMRWERYLGGLYAYLLSVRGARTLVESAEQDGIQNGIDWFVMRKAERLTAFECDPPLASAAQALPGSGVDSDIQYDGEPVAPAPPLSPRAAGGRAGTLAALAPSAVAGEIALDVAPAWPCRAAAIAGDGSEFRMIVRTVPEAPGTEGEAVDYLVRLDAALQVLRVDPLAPAGDEGGLTAGDEDVRLFTIGGGWFASSLRSDGSGGRRTPTLFRLDGPEIAESTPLDFGEAPPPAGWAPFVEADGLRFVGAWSPTAVFGCALDGRHVSALAEQAAPACADGLVGASNGVEVAGGWLFLAHGPRGASAGRRHRFVLLDRNHCLGACSRELSLLGGDDELCGGLVLAGEALVLSFRVDRRSAALAKVDLGEVLGLLEPTG